MNPFDPGLEFENPLIAPLAAWIVWGACWRAMFEAFGANATTPENKG